MLSKRSTSGISCGSPASRLSSPSLKSALNVFAASKTSCLIDFRLKMSKILALSYLKKGV